MSQGKKQIQKIDISNFKSFKSLEINNISHFNLFIGVNNIGKTSVLEALAMLFGFFPKKFLHRFLHVVRTENLEEIQDLLMFFHNYDPNNSIELVSSFQDRSKIKLKLQYQKELDSEKISCKFSDENHKNNFVEWDLKKETDNRSSNSKTTDEITQVLEKALAEHRSVFTSSFKVNTFDYETFDRSFCPTVRLIHRGFLLTKEETGLIQAKSSKQEILEFMQKIDPRIEGVATDGNLALLYLQNIDKPIPINHLGTGFIKILKLYLAILVNGIDAILFDEITDGLHPDTIQILLEEMIPRLVNQNIQLFATSHSYDILQKIAEYQKEERKNISVYRMFQMPEEKIEARQLSPEQIAKFFSIAELR